MTYPDASVAAFTWSGVATESFPSSATAAFNWQTLGYGTFAISSGTSASFVLTGVISAVGSIANSSSFTAERDDRAVSFSGASVITFLNPDHIFGIVAGATPDFRLSGIASGDASFAASGQFAPAGTAVWNGQVSIGAAAVLSLVSNSLASGEMRARAKARFAPAVQFERIAAFRISGCSAFAARSERFGDLRMRARSRTICRFRSAPWPW